MILRLGEVRVELISNDGEVVYQRTISENEMKKSALLEGKCRTCWKFDWKSGECGSQFRCLPQDKFEAFEAERDTMEDCLARGNWVVADACKREIEKARERGVFGKGVVEYWEDII